MARGGQDGGVHVIEPRRTDGGVINGIASFQELLEVGMVRANVSNEECRESRRLAARNLSQEQREKRC